MVQAPSSVAGGATAANNSNSSTDSQGAAAAAGAGGGTSTTSSSLGSAGATAPLGPPRYMRPPRGETDFASELPDEMLLRVLSFCDIDTGVHASMTAPRWVPLFNEKVRDGRDGGRRRRQGRSHCIPNHLQ